MTQLTWVSATLPLRGDFVTIDISARGTRFSQWTMPVHVHFRSECNRRTGSGGYVAGPVNWRLVGVAREAAASQVAAGHRARSGLVADAVR